MKRQRVVVQGFSRVSRELPIETRFLALAKQVKLLLCPVSMTGHFLLHM